MARILFSTYMVRYPMGGNLSWAIQYAVGFRQLGHEVFILERANYPAACYDPERRCHDDICLANYTRVRALLRRFELADCLIFQAMDGTLIGSTPTALRTLFQAADVLVDGGNHGAWLPEAKDADIPTILIDGEPGYTQIKMTLAEEQTPPHLTYDYYYSNGANIGTSRSTAPTAGQRWHHIFNPVACKLFKVKPRPTCSKFTTVMNWQAHANIEFNGHTYGQKDKEFARFIELPRLVGVPMEVAVAGRYPEMELRSNGWEISDAHSVTRTYDAYWDYIANSAAEFSICKNVFVAMQTGWFSDRSAAYLATGRPVVLQDTGFSEHLPCGRGLFAVSDTEEAATAIDAILSDYPTHSSSAREIAREYLDAKRLMGEVLATVGL